MTQKSRAAAWTGGVRGSPLQYAAQPPTYIDESYVHFLHMCVNNPPLLLINSICFPIQSEAIWNFTTNCMTLSRHKSHVGRPNLRHICISNLGSKMTPKLPQDVPRWTQDTSSWVQVGFKLGHIGHPNSRHRCVLNFSPEMTPKLPQDVPKMDPRHHKLAPGWPQVGPCWPPKFKTQMCLEFWSRDDAKITPRCPQDGPKTPQVGPKLACVTVGPFLMNT